MGKRKSLLYRIAAPLAILFFLFTSFYAAGHVDSDFQCQDSCLFCQILQLLSTLLAMACALLLFSLEVFICAFPDKSCRCQRGKILRLVSRGPPSPVVIA